MHRTTVGTNDILVCVCLGFSCVVSGGRGKKPGNLRLSRRCSGPRVPCDRKLGTDRVVLVNGIEAWLEGAGDRVFLSTQRYTPDVQYPEGWRGIVAFSATPWPTWQFQRGLTQEILARRRGE